MLKSLWNPIQTSFPVWYMFLSQFHFSVMRADITLDLATENKGDYNGQKNFSPHLSVFAAL